MAIYIFMILKRDFRTRVLGASPCGGVTLSCDTSFFTGMAIRVTQLQPTLFNLEADVPAERLVHSCRKVCREACQSFQFVTDIVNYNH